MESGFIVNRQIQYARNKSRFVFFAILPSRFAKALSLSLSLYLVFIFKSDLAVDVLSLTLSELAVSRLDVRDSWSSSRDEDHDSRDAEVELAEKKCGARAGSSSASFTYSASFSPLDPLTILTSPLSLFLFNFISEVLLTERV